MMGTKALSTCKVWGRSYNARRLQVRKCGVCFFFVGHGPSPERHAFEGCIVQTRIALPFIGRFGRGLQRFFVRNFSLRHATQFSHSSLGGATIIFAKLRSKIEKIRKIGGKVCAHHFVQIAEGFAKKILPQQFRAETVDVHLYKTFAACRYLALTASVKVRIGSPKTARNEQVCAHQKSYRK